MTNPKLIWSVIRILTFVIVGVFNTILIRPEDVGTWKNYLGYFLLALAIYDIINPSSIINLASVSIKF